MRELLKNIKNMPEVEIAETPEDFKTVAERTLKNKEKMIYYLGNVELLMQAYEQAYEDNYYIPTRMDLGIFVKILAPETDIMLKYQSGDSGQVRETRGLPGDVVMDYSVMIHDDTAVFFGKDPNLYGLSIVSPAIAHTMKAVFHDMWKRGVKAK